MTNPGDIRTQDLLARGLAAQYKQASPLPTQAGTIKRLKNAFNRALVSNPEINAVMASPPTLTAASSDTSGLTKFYTANQFASMLTITGGSFYYSSSNNRGAVANQNVAGDAGNINFVAAPQVPTVPAGTSAVGPWYLKFMTDAPVFQIRGAATAASNPIRFIVDGQYIDRVGNDLNTNNYLKFDFTSVGGRKPRLIEIEGQYAINWFSIQIDSLSRVWKPTPIDTIRAAITGDSHTEGISGIAGASWSGCSAISSRLLGIWDMYIASLGGTGYLKTGTSGLRKTIRFQLDDWCGIGKYDLVMFAGGYNDLAFTTAAVSAEALACWRKARQLQPAALIIVFGIWGAAKGPDATTIAMENALAAQFAVWADPFSIFIPVSTAFEPWEFGTGFQGATNGTGNSDNYVFTDGIHCNTAGQQHRAYRMATAVRSAVFNFVS